MRSWPWFAVGTYVKFTILVAFPVLFNFLVTSSLAECKTCANDSIKLINREFIAECLPVLLRTVKGLSIKEWWNDKRSLFAWCSLMSYWYYVFIRAQVSRLLLVNLMTANSMFLFSYLFCLRICNNPDPVFRHSKVTCLLEDLRKIFRRAFFLFTD